MHVTCRDEKFPILLCPECAAMRTLQLDSFKVEEVGECKAAHSKWLYLWTYVLKPQCRTSVAHSRTVNTAAPCTAAATYTNRLRMGGRKHLKGRAHQEQSMGRRGLLAATDGLVAMLRRGFQQ